MRDPWIPRGFHTITPNIIADDAEEAIAFLEAGLGATEDLHAAWDRFVPIGKRAHAYAPPRLWFSAPRLLARVAFLGVRSSRSIVAALIDRILGRMASSRLRCLFRSKAGKTSLISQCDTAFFVPNLFAARIVEVHFASACSSECLKLTRATITSSTRYLTRNATAFFRICALFRCRSAWFCMNPGKR